MSTQYNQALKAVTGMRRPLAVNVFIMLQACYRADNLMLHDNVSNLIDALLAYHSWALNFQHDEHRHTVVIEELSECLCILHRAMGIVGTHSVDYLPSGRLVEYAVGFVAQYFWAA